MRALLRNKSVCIIGDSVQRTIYKDFVTLLQKNSFATVMGLKAKGEETYMNDELVDGGIRVGLHNGTTYKEHRLYETPNHSVRFFFVTRAWDEYWEHAVMPTLILDPKPDVIIVNSCLWDLTRYGPRGGVESYKDSLKRLLDEMKANMPPETLFIWNTTLPLSSDPEKIHGGFLVAEVSVQDKMYLRLDILEANKFASELVAEYDYDVLDMHYWFRGHQEHRVRDGIHWDNEATRQMTNMLLTRIADSWGVGRPGRLFQIALIGYDKDPMLLKELFEAEQAMKKDREEAQAELNNSVTLSHSLSAAYADRSVSAYDLAQVDQSRLNLGSHSGGSKSCTRLNASATSNSQSLLSLGPSAATPPLIGSPGESTDSHRSGEKDDNSHRNNNNEEPKAKKPKRAVHFAL